MIAIVYPQFYGVGGIARYLDSFLSNLPPDHPPIYLLTGDEHKVTRNYPGVEIIHIPFTSNRFNLFVWGWKARRLLLQLYAEGKIEWVNLHFPPLIPGLFMPKHIPVVLTAHTTYLGMSGRFYETQHFKSQWGRLSLMIKSWMEKRIFNQACKVITLTEQGRQEVLMYGFKGPIAVIPNGADISLFSPRPDTKRDIDLLFCGRIEFRKGSRAMVALCKLLITKKADIRIVIVGYGDDDVWVTNELKAYAKNITLTGKVPFNEMINYYNRSRIYVSTSYYEGLPGTCLEAMAMQLPVVAWDFLFYQRLVINNKTGFLIKTNDFTGMTNKILDMLSNPEQCQQIGYKTRELLIKDYNWKVLSQSILSFFSIK